MKPGQVTPESASFVLVSFEGPDQYSRAGGLATRVTELASALAKTGFDTHLAFVGSPQEPGRETRQGGKLTLHRWCQWISRYYPEGVYEGEEEKLYDLNESLPWAIKEQIVEPAAEQGKVTVVIGEEWHTTEAMCRLSDILFHQGLRDRAILLWNANNTFSFHRINWGRLAFTTTITTVSRFMKHILWQQGVNPIVVPNGIPTRFQQKVDEKRVREVRGLFPSDVVLFKLGRWDPDKRWLMAVEAAAQLRGAGVRPTLILRGGKEPHEGEVLHHARSIGLRVVDVHPRSDSLDDAITALAAARDADLINLKSYLSEELVRTLYSAADGVLANSGFEPFGLVGLEAMASGGLVYTGCTGEDYAISFENALMLETSDPAEIVRYAIQMFEHPDDAARLREAGRLTASRFGWNNAIDNLVTKLDFLGRRSGALTNPVSQVPLKEDSVDPSREQPARRRRAGSRQERDLAALPG